MFPHRNSSQRMGLKKPQIKLAGRSGYKLQLKSATHESSACQDIIWPYGWPKISEPLKQQGAFCDWGLKANEYLIELIDGSYIGKDGGMYIQTEKHQILPFCHNCTVKLYCTLNRNICASQFSLTRAANLSESFQKQLQIQFLLKNGKSSPKFAVNLLDSYVLYLS